VISDMAESMSARSSAPRSTASSYVESPRKRPAS
jgi:hypothetical protein